ncbi:hypothetical protein BMS3Bbin14_00079 [bacterium BMS3Bbin14]|nr:hypothetical protein BMS3Bbin14_00079 [bacterium BMS3Bbin14]
MRRIILFVEDYGHEAFISSVIQRFAKEQGKVVKIIPRSARGGHGKAVAELKLYLRELRNEKVGFPDLLVVATDANCSGYQGRRKEIDAVIADWRNISIYAIPDPHIERWLLLDSAAFKSVMGKGCDAPDHKCERGRYKKILMDAMLQAGIHPSLGGIEFTEDIVNAMDFERMEQTDASLGQFLKSVRNKFREWA